jgi:hypothetical protein
MTVDIPIRAGSERIISDVDDREWLHDDSATLSLFARLPGAMARFAAVKAAARGSARLVKKRVPRERTLDELAAVHEFAHRSAHGIIPWDSNRVGIKFGA